MKTLINNSLYLVGYTDTAKVALLEEFNEILQVAFSSETDSEFQEALDAIPMRYFYVVENRDKTLICERNKAYSREPHEPLLEIIK